MDEDPKNKDVTDSYFVPYCIVDRGGVKVAVIGMTNANIKSWLSASTWRGIDFQEIHAIAQRLVDYVIGKEKNILDKFAMAMTSTSRFAFSCLPSSLERKMELMAGHGTPNSTKKR